MRTLLSTMSLALLAFSPGAFADEHCNCSKECQEQCQRGEAKNCDCKTCDCAKSGKCKHGKCTHGAHGKEKK